MTPKALAEWAARCCVEYMEANPDDPIVLRFRAELAALDESLRALEDDTKEG